MKIVALVLLLVLLAAAAAGASTPTSYRVRVNWICRGYAPTGRRLETELERAQAAGDYGAWSVALDRALRLDLEQDRRIEAVSVPDALEPAMGPITRRLRVLDAHLRAARTRPVELLAIHRLAAPLNAELGDAGLSDCRS